MGGYDESDTLKGDQGNDLIFHSSSSDPTASDWQQRHNHLRARHVSLGKFQCWLSSYLIIINKSAISKTL